MPDIGHGGLDTRHWPQPPQDSETKPQTPSPTSDQLPHCQYLAVMGTPRDTTSS